MSDKVLQYVLADLRPLIVPKLQAEVDAHLGPGGSANAKKGTVDVKRGDFYQFAYFLRKTEPHSVLIKTRTFSAAPPQPKQTAPASKLKTSRTWKGKRKPSATESPGKRRKKRKTKGKGRAGMEDSDEEELAISTGDDSDIVTPHSPQIIGEALRRSGRAKKLVAGGYRQDEEGDADYAEDIHMATAPDPSVEPRTTTAPPELSIDDAQMLVLEQSQSSELPAPVIKEEGQEHALIGQSNTANPAQPEEQEGVMEPESPEIELMVDEEETKPKPLLQLKYQGFNISGNCLCVVVEPWPPIQAVSRASSIVPIFSSTARAPSIGPPDVMPSGQLEAMHRERTPLFLPDPDRRRSETPAPFVQGRVLPPVPLFNDPVDQEIEYINDDTLMEFSQALNYAGDHRGALEEDDEFNGGVFFGDADEAREF
jgi:hypothetical protein